MENQRLTSTLSDDLRSLICLSVDGAVRWVRKGPSSTEWQNLMGKVIGDPDNGTFLYTSDEQDGCIIAVFTPRCAPDYNVRYDANTGELLEITQTR
jgi:hypothetical protein